MKAIHNESKSTINLLKKQLKIKLYWIALFIALFVGIGIYFSDQPTIVMVMMIAMVLYGGGGYFILKEYKKMGISNNFNNSTLDIMKENLRLIKSALQRENIFGYITMPIAIVGAFLMSDTYGGLSFQEAIVNLFTLNRLIIGLVLGVTMMLVAMYMNKLAFKSQIDKLENQIHNLESAI